MARRRDGRLPLLAGLVAVAAAMLPALGADFVALDDSTHITANVQLQSDSPLAFLVFWRQPYFGLYVPMAYTAWSFLALISRALTSTLHPAVFHAASLALHLVNVVLVQRLLCRIVPAAGREGALIGALVFALHPVQVESVAWASELRGLLAACFGLWALLVALEEHADGDAGRIRRAALATGLCLCAMLSKPAAVALPIVLLALQRFALARSWPQALRLPGIWLTLGLALTAATKALQSDVDLDYVPSLVERPLVALDALGFHARQVVWPLRLSVDYGRTPSALLAQGSHAFYSATFALCALALAAWLGRARPRVACASLLFVTPLLPVLGFVPFDFQDISTVADRYAYFAYVGVAYAVAVGYGELSRPAFGARRTTLGALSLLAVLGVASHLQARVWHDDETLFAHVLDVNPRSFGAHHGLASRYFQQGHYALALRHCELALAAKPTYLPAEKGVADALLAMGDREAAITQYQSTLQRHAGVRGNRRGLLAQVHADLAVALYQRGDAAGAIEQLRAALALSPELAVAQRNLDRLLALRAAQSSAASSAGSPAKR